MSFVPSPSTSASSRRFSHQYAFNGVEDDSRNTGESGALSAAAGIAADSRKSAIGEKATAADLQGRDDAGGESWRFRIIFEFIPAGTERIPGKDPRESCAGAAAAFQVEAD